MLKKSIALLLAVVMILISSIISTPVSASVRGDVNNNGGIDTNDYILVKRYVLGTIGLTATQKAAADVDNDGDVDSIDYVTIKRLAFGTLDYVYETVPISKSKPYTTDKSASETYPDSNGTELTNGAVASSASYYDEAYCGFNSDVNVTINLGAEGKKIKAFELSYLNTSGAGIYSPASVRIYGGNSPTSCNTILATKDIVHEEGVTAIKSVKLYLTDFVEYSYIRFYIKRNYKGAWLFIDEAVVYSVTAKAVTPQTDFYASDSLTDTQRAAQLSGVASSQVYDPCIDTTVISAGAAANVSCSGYDSRLTYKSTYLTDGSATGSHFSKNVWVGLNMSAGATITLTLANTYSNAINDIRGFSVHCFNRPDESIILPDYIDVSVSKDGYTYYTVGRVYAPSDEGENYTYSLRLTTLVSAKYVRFTFPKADGYLWIEEAEVLANRNSSASAITTTGYLSPDSGVLGGAKDIALIYHNAGNVTSEMLLPYVAYIDDNGNILDTMFDGFLFLPSVGQMYLSGSTPYGTNKLEDWNWMFDEIFKEGYCLDALDDVAKRVKFALGDRSLKLKVYVTIPHMDTTLTDFGDVDGDGISESFARLDVRVYVAKLFAEKVINKFNSENYENLELCGFYWFHEEISGDDVETAKSVNNSFDYLGYPMFWIPYFLAGGFLSGYDYGFDAVCLQPNYAFDMAVDASRLEVASNCAKQKGMAIEMEICSSALADKRFFQKYMDYLSGGVKYGYMNNSIHMYYQEFDIIGKSASSKIQRNRLIYKYTYDFIKGKLDITPDKNSPISILAYTDTAVSGTVNREGNDVKTYRLSGSPSHGSLSFSADGSYVYYPNKGYKGADTFTYQVGNYLGWSQECTVTVTVG